MWKKIQFWLTLKQIGLFYNPFQEVDEFTTWSGTHTVYWFSDKRNPTFGQLTLANTIILNRERMKHLSDEAAKVVVEHEVGHQNRSSLARGVFYGLVLLWIPLGVWILYRIGVIATTSGAANLRTLFPPTVLGVAFIFFGILAMNVEELFADFHVLQYVPYDDYLEARAEVAENRIGSRLTSVIRYVQYTKPERVADAHEKLSQHGLLNWFTR